MFIYIFCDVRLKTFLNLHQSLSSPDDFDGVSCTKKTIVMLKGLGHAILGNLSTDRMVIELPKISK